MSRYARQFKEAIVTITVWPEAVPPTEMVREVRDIFINWLAENHPELRVGPGTQWTEIDLRAYILVVSYYMFMSDER